MKEDNNGDKGKRDKGRFAIKPRKRDNKVNVSISFYFLSDRGVKSGSI